MEAAGFGLAIIAEARTLVSNIKTRIANIQNGPDTFRSLTHELDRLMRHITEVETHLQSAPAAIPASIRAVFNETLASVRDILNRCNSTLEIGCAKAFPEGSPRVTVRIKSLLRRTARASALGETMSALQPQVQGASGHLLTLISMLVTGLKSQEQQEAIGRITGNVEEVYRVGSSTPALPQGAHLNFSAKDTEGNHITPEGILKECILSSESSSTVTAAAGVITAALGVVGMAGVGKTTALQGLAFDKDIRIRFPDGIQYIALGQDASSPTAIREVAKIMRLTGASASVSVVERSSTLREAVDYAVAWFEGKICLFIVDDLWPTENRETGMLNDLRQLLRCCSKSRMAITTRSTNIADAAGRTVDFAPRAPLGAVSVTIFMMHATRDATKKAPQEPTGDLRRSIATILTICAGLPIALAVTGCTVAFLAKELGDFEGACDEYASQLVKKRIELGEKQGPGGSSLNAGIALSMKILETEFLKLMSRNTTVSQHTIADLYTSLCVLRHQATIPVSVLSRMWKVGKDIALAVVRLFSGLSLCKLTFCERANVVAKERGVMLHDLQLDFCKRKAETTKTSSLWHTRLLNGYLKPALNAGGGSLLSDEGGSFGDTVLNCAPRPWWSAPNDGYIHVDLARHLTSADLVIELAALLLDARWTYIRAEIGGMLALKSDFECLLTVDSDILPHSVCQSFELIWKAILLSWGRLAEGQRSFLFQICGRLFNSRTDNAIVDWYLKSVEMRTPLPFLRPVNPFFPEPCDAQVMEIPVGITCWAVSCSPCGRFIAAGAGRDVVIAEVSTGDILKRLEGHSANITSVSFAVGSKKVVSGSRDNSVVVWEWETSESPVQVFKGHNKWVNGVALSSDAAKVFSCADDCTLRIWDANTGAQIGAFIQQNAVKSVAVSNDDHWVAIGLTKGTVKVVDSCSGDTIFADFHVNGSPVTSVAFSAKDERLAAGSGDRTIRAWETATWTSIGGPFRGHTSWVKSVTFSRDGQVASASSDGTVRFWDANTGKNIWTSSNMHNDVISVAFTAAGKRIVSASMDGIIRVWDVRVEVEASERDYGRSARVWAVAISHDGLRVASGSEGGAIRLWDAQTGNQIGRSLEGHSKNVSCVSFSHDGRQLVSGSSDKTIRVWNAETSNQIGDPLEGHTDFVRCVSFSSNGLRIVSGSWDATVRIWDAKSGKQIGDALEGHTEHISAVSESYDGSHVVSRDNRGTVVIWNRNKRTIVWKSKRRTIR